VIRHSRRCFAVTAVLAQLFAIKAVAAAQAQPFPSAGLLSMYEKLRHEIADIKAFDNHGHPGLPDDSEVDAMSIPANSSLPFRLREENPEFVAAARALFGYPYSDFSHEHVSSLIKEKQTLVAWVLRKFKRFKRHKVQASQFLQRLATECVDLFVHWQLGMTGVFA
jgi:hypothetical protein